MGRNQFILTDDISVSVSKIIQSRIDAFNPQRRMLLLETKANLAYLVGEQNIFYENGEIKPITDPRLINPVANVILPAVQKDIAVSTQNAPKFDVVPSGTDDDDKATAIVCQKIIQHLQRTIGKDLKRSQVMLWYDIAGIGWRKVYWNPSKTVLGPNPEPVDENGIPNPSHDPNVPVGQALTKGEICIDCIPPYQLIYDYRTGDVNDLEWIIHAKKISKQEVFDRFGAEISYKLSGRFNKNSAENNFETSIIHRFQALDIGGSQSTYTPKMSAMSEMKLDSDKYIDYYEFWQKPCVTNPSGAFAIMIDDQLVWHEPYPVDLYIHGELPFIPSCPMEIGSFLNGAISRISQARPLQREYNRLKAQIAENIDIMGNAIIMSPKKAKIQHRTLDNGAGNIIEYDSVVGKPTREPGVPMNSQVFPYVQEIKQNIESIFAFNEPTRGIAPRNIESGKGILALQNADLMLMNPIVSALEESDEKLVYQACLIAIKNYEPGRQIHVIGSDYEWTLYQVDPAQMQGKMNVIVKPGSSLPTDKENEANKAFQVWQSGLLGDPNDPAIRTWTLDQMHLGNQENILQKQSKQRNFATKEFQVAINNLKELDIPEGASAEYMADEIKKRIFVPAINPFDDHLLHIMMHNEFLIDNYWELAATGNPIVLDLLKSLFMHVQQHQQVIDTARAQEMQRQIMAEMMIKGTTPQQLAARKAKPEQSDSK